VPSCLTWELMTLPNPPLRVQTGLLITTLLFAFQTAPVLAGGSASLPTHAEFVFIGADGKRFPADSLKGRPRILHFFAGRCGSCRNDDRLLRESAFDYADQGVVLLNVYRNRALKGRSADGLALIPGVPEMTDPLGHLAAAYHLGDQSGTVFLDRQGLVVAQLPGGLNQVTVLRNLNKILTN
jgi:cytochrome oxidase Cu insertion factor (SCO1/SenC/PrrC family)